MKYLLVSSALMPCMLAFGIAAADVTLPRTIQPQSPRPAQSGSGPTTVVQMSYYARPEKEEEVLRLRIRASAVLESQGASRGRVLRRIQSARATVNTDDPDVIWEAEFPDSMSLKRYEEIAVTHPEFLSIRREMGTVTRKVERRYWELQ